MNSSDSRFKPEDAVCSGGTGRVSSRILFFLVLAVVLAAFVAFLLVGNLKGHSVTPKRAVAAPSRQQ